MDSSTGAITAVTYGETVATALIGNSTYPQEYDIRACEVAVRLEVVYDNAYLTRYSGGYERVCTHLDELQAFYFQNFRLGIDCSNPKKFTSYADQYCYSSPITNCDHGVCSNSMRNENGTTVLADYHHKNISNIVYRISLPGAESEFKLAFIGHDVCDADFGVCCREHPELGDPAYGVTSLPLGIMAIMNTVSTEAELRTTIHEFGHLLGARDHYGDPYPTTSEMIIETGDFGFSPECIYGEQKNNEGITQSNTICDGCKALIEAGISACD